MVPAHRDITNERVDRDSMFPIVVGRQQSTGDIRRKPASVHGHGHGGPRECVSAANGRRAQDRGSASGDPPGNVWGRERGGVEQDNTFEQFGTLEHRGQPDRATPIVSDQRDPVELELVDQGDQIVAVCGKGVSELVRLVAAGWLIAASAAEVVDSDDAIRWRKPIYNATKIVAPCGIPMHTEERFRRLPGAFIEVAQLMRRDA